MTVKAAQPGEIVSPISAGGGFTRTGIGTIVDMDSLEIQVDVNENFINRVATRPEGDGKTQRLSRLADPGARDRGDPHRRPQQGHGDGAHRARPERPAYPAGNGRSGVIPGGRPERRGGAKPAPRL